MDIAFNGQKTEHNFVGVKSGLMDQFASLHGKKGYVMKLDCRSLEYEYIPFDFPSYKIVLVNSMVHHSLASSEYNVRRQQCEEGVAILKKHFPEIVSLRDVSIAQLDEYKSELPAIVYQRCRYVVEENDRLLKACEVMKANDLDSFGQLMYRTHEGLSKEYEVSCPELDFLVEQARKVEAVAGSRMMGGGFGGCTINIVESDGVNDFVQFIQNEYRQQYNKTPDVYITQIEDGSKVVEY
jgi:galactokinase